MSCDAARLVLIPSYNTGAKLLETVVEARRCWEPVWVVIDGSTDGSGQELMRRAAKDPGLRVIPRPQNEGKGAAILHGLRAARDAGFTHALTMDADGQHDAASIAAMMALSGLHPEAMILGVPIFGSDAPRLRVGGRKVSNFWANLATLWVGIGDSLFGFRVYPIAPLLEVFADTRWMRRFDFDPEAAIRLSWRGVLPVNLATPVRYFRPEEGGVSHFNYLRDNLLLTAMYARLLAGFLVRLPVLMMRRVRSSRR